VVNSKTSKFFVAVILITVLVTVTFLDPKAPASTPPEKTWRARTCFAIYSNETNTPSINPLATTSPTGLSPAQVQKAYNLSATSNNGTIAIVDAYDYPTAQNDFVNFSNQFDLPTSNFEKHQMPGATTSDPGWALEEALDIEWAHAIAPNSKILLVEANSSYFYDLIAAINYAISRPDVVAVSMSWGGDEFNGEQAYDSLFTSNHGIVFFASSGDSGAGVIWPSSSSNVIAVGGTTLSLRTDGSVASETAWSGSGGGISAHEPEPSYQISYGVSGTNGKRAIPDVSYDANPNSGFSVYDSTAYLGQTGWFQVGGTSAGSPQWAAIRALGLSASNSNFYVDANNITAASYFRDIVSGSNGEYSAGPGFDFVTGLGSPVTTNYIPNQDFSVSALPTNLTLNNSASGNSTLTIASLNGFYGTVTLSATMPSGWSANFMPQSVNVPFGGNTSSLLSFTVNSSTKAGLYQVAAKGTNVLLNHNAFIAVNVQTVPSAPQNLTVNATPSQIVLNWIAPSDNGGLNVTGYSIYKGNSSGAETKLASIGNVLSYVDTQVLNGQNYFYAVTANNSLGESSKSGEVNMTVLNSIVTFSNFVVQSGGSGYTTPAVLLMGGGGSGATATSRVSNGVIIGIVLTNPGTGYTSAPDVVFRDPSPRAQGAVAIAVMTPIQ